MSTNINVYSQINSPDPGLVATFSANDEFYQALTWGDTNVTGLPEGVTADTSTKPKVRFTIDTSKRINETYIYISVTSKA